MLRQRVVLAAASPLLMIWMLVAPACSGSVGREARPPAAHADADAGEGGYPGDGEILSEEPWPDRHEEDVADRMGGALVAVTFVAAVVAAALLPLLLFL